MLVREYLSKFNENQSVTFIKAIAQFESDARGCEEVYQTTPIRQAYEWQNSPIMDYYILNHKQSPITWLSGASWVRQFENGSLLSLLVISEADLALLYSQKQATDIISYIDEVIKGE